jgi:cytochrome bd ubiquinol oxidase subunit II
MVDLWFFLVSLLLAAYVVFDGFDLGAGALHRWVARTDAERREVISAIGPFWDGNEVFLLAAGGTLFIAFSKVLAASLSGLYLAVMLVLWVLLLRGIAIEFRSHVRDGVWRSFWDTIFQAASGGLALLLGVALGDVLRGFPLRADGYFALELFSLRSPALGLGVIDAYTLSTGVLAVLVLLSHGARFLAFRTEGAVRSRAERFAERVAIPIAIAWVIVTALSFGFARPALTAFESRPLAWLLVLAGVGAFGASWGLGRRGDRRTAFVASCVFVLSMVALAAASAYPVLLRSTNPDVASLTAQAAANHEQSLAAGLRWWFLAAAFVILYFVNLFRIHGSKAAPYGEGAEDDGADGHDVS